MSLGWVLTLLGAVMVMTWAAKAEAGERFRRSEFADLDDRDDDSAHALSVGGAVSSPSETAFLGQNPAGLIYNRSSKVLGLLSTASDGSNPAGLLANSGMFFAGDGASGISLGYQSYSNTQDSGGSVSFFDFGLGTYAEKLNFAFGLSGDYRFRKQGQSPAPQFQNTWAANLGALFNPYGGFRAGFTIYGVSQGIQAYGMGFATDVNSHSIFSLDASTNQYGRGLTLKPALGIRASSIQMTYGYGYAVDRGIASGITPGNTLGVGYEFNPSFQLQGYYNLIEMYYLGATLKF